MPDLSPEEVYKRIRGSQPPESAAGAMTAAEAWKRISAGQQKPAEAETPGLGAAIWEGIKRAGSDIVEQGKRIGATQLGGPEMMMQFSPADEKAISDRLTQQEKQSAASYEASPARQAYPPAAGAARVVGNIAAAAPLAAVPAGGPGMALGGRMALGGAMGGATGGPMGAAAGGALGGLGGMIGPAVSPAFQAIAQKIPQLAQMAIGAEGRAGRAGEEGFQRSFANWVLDPIKKMVPKGIKPGEGLINHVGDELDHAYDTILKDPKVIFRATEVDPYTGQSFRGGLAELAEKIPESHGKDFEKILNTKIDKRLDAGGNMSAQKYKDALSDIGREARYYSAHNSQGDDRKYGEALKELQEHMRETLALHNPPQADALKRIDQSWARYVQMEEAAGRRFDSNSEFRPNDLLAVAAKQYGRRALAQARQPLMAFGRAGNDLISGKPPNFQKILEMLGGAAGATAGAHMGAGIGGAFAGRDIGRQIGGSLAGGAASRIVGPGSRTAGELLGRAAPVAGGVTDETHISPVGP